MRALAKVLIVFLLFSLLALSALSRGSYTASAAAQDRSNDGPPVVKITTPLNGTTRQWNSLVNYSIVVTYRGKSTQYQEIPSKDVLLKATYIPDLSATAGKPAATADRTPAGVLAITGSDCLGCHQFKAKAMGPSFAAIAERYPDNQASLDTLSRYIRQGSAGLWGQASMPPHPGMTVEQLNAIVAWIEKHAGDPNSSYYAGTEGSVQMKAPSPPTSNSGMILTASYTTPVSPANPEKVVTGEDTVILRGRR